MKNNLIPIIKESWPYVIGAIFLFMSFVFLDLDFLQFFAFLAAIFFIFVFRNPKRQHPYYQSNSVISPVDGCITSIRELKNSEYLYKIEITSSYSNVSLLRVPFTSTIKSISKQNGSRLSLHNPLSKKINENVELVFVDKDLNSIKIIHRLKQSFMGINIKVTDSQSLNQGVRYGVMVNGSTTIYLPKNFRLNISVGNNLVACETLIGYFTELTD